MDPILKLTNISRSFGAIQALNGVNFQIFPGEVMGLVGENGAGKSSLVKIISGFDDGYSGEYQLRGNSIRFRQNSQAEQAGVAIAQQELSLIPSMTVAENIFLAGHNVSTFATRRMLAKQARPYLDQVGLSDIDPLLSVDHFSIGEQHLIEVARLVAHDPSVVILDEPTAALGEADSVRILQMVERLARNGKSVIYVSHRLDEIFRICHRVTVMRDGESQPARPIGEFNVTSLIEVMLGRELTNMFPKRVPRANQKKLLSVSELWPDGLLEPVNFSVRSGEILGLAGQLGSGAGEVLAAIAGSLPSRSGLIEFLDERFLPRTPKDAIFRGIAYCSSDRKKDGLFLSRPISENLTAAALGTVSKFGWNFGFSEGRRARALAEAFTVDAERLGSECAVLSGGNQQKVALGKWLAISPKIILVDEPTRGVDVGARAEIYNTLRMLANQGAAVVFASTDIQEMTYLPDRVITFYRGLQVDEIDLEQLTSSRLLKQITDPFNEATP